MADYSLVDIKDQDIVTLIDNYFDALYFQDMSLFDRVFHADCVLYSAQGGTLSIRPFAQYRELVTNRESPANSGKARRDKVLMFDQISPALALVKPQLEIFGGVMQDYLNLVYVGNQWWVVAKMWEKVRDAAN